MIWLLSNSGKNEVEQHGLVISYFGNSVAVCTEDGQVIPCHLRRNQALPVVGDQVLWQLEQEGKSGIILDIAPRRSLLTRGTSRGQQQQALAANIDFIIIVMAPPPVFSEYLIDRYLLAAELLSINALLVLNKSDLLDAEGQSACDTRLSSYRLIPYPVFCTSALNKDGTDALAAHLTSKSAVLVGPSGVGKSSLIMALSEHEHIATRDVSAKGSGKHTTTATRLYRMPQGGNLIDSPGVREFNLWPVTKEEIFRGFKEFYSLEGQCKFRNCQHLSEPNCIIRQALDEGNISQARFNSYKTLMAEKKHA
jgi:ribosome biogenesis GTPase / thiamine phosphate phosphatase